MKNLVILSVLLVCVIFVSGCVYNFGGERAIVDEEIETESELSADEILADDVESDSIADELTAEEIALLEQEESSEDGTIIDDTTPTGQAISVTYDSCGDTDKGKVLTKKGTVTSKYTLNGAHKTKIRRDRCHPNKKGYVIEYFCKGDKKIGAIARKCSNGCENGACKITREYMKCEDSDDLDYYNKGTVKAELKINGVLRTRKYTDKNHASKNTHIIEYYCDGKRARARGVNCIDGRINGACKTVQSCGNGVIENPEQCDDGNTVNGDGCSEGCKRERKRNVCGNGKLERKEQCDDGNTMNGDGCGGRCSIEGEPDCEPRTIGYWSQPCKNHFNHETVESMENYLQLIHGMTDFFNDIENFEHMCGILEVNNHSLMYNKAMQQIMATWLNVASGKIFLDTRIDLGDLSSAETVEEALHEAEQLVQSNETDDIERAKNMADKLNNAKGANSVILDCTPGGGYFCGDGKLDEGEECDDGNNMDGDGCSAECETEDICIYCGDGILNQEWEQCDDGNNMDGDGCDSGCKIEKNPCPLDVELEIDFVDIKNYAEGANLKKQVFVGATDIYNQENIVIPLTNNGEFIVDNTILGDVEGISLQRLSDGMVRLLLYGNHASVKEHLIVNMRFKNAIITGYYNDMSYFDGALNKLDRQGDGQYILGKPGYDELFYTIGESDAQWYSTVGPANDGFFLDIECAQTNTCKDCKSNNNCTNYCEDKILHTGSTCDNFGCCTSGAEFNCEDKDGPEETDEFVWISSGECEEKEMRKVLYKKHTCVDGPPAECSVYATTENWVETGETRIVPGCGVYCGDGFMNQYLEECDEGVDS